MSPLGLTLFLGPDRPRKLRRIQELARRLGVGPLDQHRLDAPTTRPEDLAALCRQRPAASPVRLIVVDDAERLGATAVAALLAHATLIAQNACVVLLVDAELGLRHPLKQAAHRMRIERFPGAAAAPDPFALTDALGGRRVAEALGAVRDQLGAGHDPLKLLGLIGWQLQQWVLVRRLWEAGCRGARLASAAGIKPWQADRASGEVADRPLARLQDLLARCWRLDAEIKTGRMIPELGVEQLVMEICLARPPVSDPRERRTHGVAK